MNGQRLILGHAIRRCPLRPWLVAQLMGVVIALAPQLFGQYIYVSVSASVGSDGTLYATGVTNAGGMQAHSATVTTTVSSPIGRYAWASQSVSSGGYAVATASLAFDQNDCGSYLMYASGSGY
jgi:hypothetical protein